MQRHLSHTQPLPEYTGLHRIGVMVPDDFLRLHELQPGLFTEVAPQYPRDIGSRRAADPSTPPQATVDRVYAKLLHLLKMPGAMVAVGVSSMPQAALRSISLLLYAASLGSLSKALWVRLASTPWPFGSMPLLQMVQKTASVSAAAVLLHGVAVWLGQTLHARHGSSSPQQRRVQRVMGNARSTAELASVRRHAASL